MENLLLKHKKNFFVVGIGASAGGVHAIQSFFSSVKKVKDISYIVFLHSDPSQKSILKELIQEKTDVPVQNIKQNVEISAGNIYVVPENCDVQIKHQHFNLTNANFKNCSRNPIDQLFIEIANAYHDRAISVVLSGSGNDGMQGCIKTKQEEGLIAVQSIEDATFPDMPCNTCSATLCDIIAPANSINQAIETIINHQVKNLLQLNNEPNIDETLNCIFALLKVTTTHNFSNYKKNTILRRIKRRMQLTSSIKVEDYAAFLVRNEPERFNLMAEFLIGVTQFFRDKEVWELLKNVTLPSLLKNKNKDQPFRAWIAGCASGEEAYSLAFLLYDLLQKNNFSQVKIQIFATDLSQQSIEFARKGRYPKKIIKQFTAEEIARYFTLENNTYVVKQTIRDYIVFAPHNLLSDPPYTKLDLVCCRNVIIYLNQNIHHHLFKKFHYCLNNNGLLLLGNAESIDNDNPYFSIDKNKVSLYKKLTANTVNLDYLSSKSVVFEKSLKSKQVKMKEQKPLDMQQHLVEYIQQDLSPSAILVNQQGEILNIYGDTTDFLTPLPGKANLSIHTMAKNIIHAPLLEILDKAQEQKSATEIIVNNNEDEKHHYLRIRVEPFYHQNMSDLWLISFQKFNSNILLPTISPSQLNEQYQHRVNFLEQSLLKSQHETQIAKEEMQTSSEELMSTNEELQSTNEELTTSTEELRTMNEQLILARQQAEKSLSRFIDLYDSAPVGYFTLNKEGKILSVNKAGKVLIAESIDEQVGSRLTLYIIEQDRQYFSHLLETVFNDKTAQSIDTAIWHDSLNLRYVTIRISAPNEHQHCRVIITDITEKTIQQRQSENKNKILSLTAQNAPLKTILEAIIKLLEQDNPNMICSILLLDESGKHLVNGVGEKLPEFYRKAIEGVTIGEGVGSCGTAAFRKEQVIVENIQTDPLWQDYKELAAQANLKACWSQPIIDSEQKLLGTFAIYHQTPSTPSKKDIALIEHHAILAEIAIAHHQATKQLKMASLVFKNSCEASMVFDANNIIIAVNPAFSKITGYSESEIIGQSRFILHSGKHDEAFYKNKSRTLNKIGRWQGELWGKHKDGHLYAQWMAINTIYDENHQVEKRIALFFDITEKKKTEQIIWQQANFDSLTGLPNRRMFFDRLKQESKRARRDKNKLAVILIDLDNFKEVNDVYGHDQGDLLLIEITKRLQNCIRQADTLARLGGDEFTVVVTEVKSERSLELIAQQIIEQMQAPVVLNNNIAYITASIGITVFPDDTEKVDKLLKHADQAMYQAKGNGKNNFCYFTTAMQEAAETRLSLINDLRLAIKEQQFTLYFQPIFCLEQKTITKAEVLIRWQHPIKGVISPIEFIPLAEETGLIIELGDWIFKTAIQQLLHWQKIISADFSLAINVSPIQFLHKENIISQWINFLNSNNIDGKNITIEITEGLLLDANSFVKEQLTLLAKNNISVALDDFGTGYSSLSYLKELDIDYLKIDKSFVDNLASDKNDQALCQAIIVMAHQLDIKVIAEGVETDIQNELLSKANCDYIQGYHIAKPMPALAFEKLVTSQNTNKRSQ